MSNSDTRTNAERVTLAISVLILIAVVATAIWAGDRVGSEPPEIHVEAMSGGVRESETGFYVPVTITNRGGLTAQNVVVTGELDLGDGEPETGEVTIDFLAGGESEEATLVFSSHPEDGEFEVGVTSYLKP